MLESKSVLIVDDDQGVLNALKRLFIGEGYTIHTADCAGKGLELLEREKIDLILSDQKMPGMSGIEFLEKTVENYTDVIRIIMTGYAELGDAIRAVNSGCVYKFIQKPWNNDDLKITVKRALEQYSLLIKNRDLTMELKKRDKILEDLERKHPGITQHPKDGCYEINL